MKTWFPYYNQERFHQSLKNWTPDEIYFKKQSVVQTLGYQTADIAWIELFTAIQTGVVDGDGKNR
ncbi:hypothetical protein JCM12294_42950 [Desulfocicer niacini]